MIVRGTCALHCSAGVLKCHPFFAWRDDGAVLSYRPHQQDSMRGGNLSEKKHSLSRHQSVLILDPPPLPSCPLHSIFYHAGIIPSPCKPPRRCLCGTSWWSASPCGSVGSRAVLILDDVVDDHHNHKNDHDPKGCGRSDDDDDSGRIGYLLCLTEHE